MLTALIGEWPLAFVALELAWILGAAAWLVLEKRSPHATLAWVFALAWMPVIGVVVYLLLGPRRLRRKRLRHELARQAVAGTAPAQLPQAAPELDERVAAIEAIGLAGGDGPALRCRSLSLYFDGAAAYRALEEAIAAARHHVHACYYIFAADRAGAWMRDLLAERARAGVEVRLLVDAIGSSSLTAAFLRPLCEAGAEVAWFNPIRFASLRSRLVNFRTHRKIVVCDGVVGFTGGMNVTDVHAATYVGDAAWRDTHLRVDGAAVRWLQKVFLEDWCFATGGAPRGEAYLVAARPDGDRIVQILSSGPDEGVNPVARAMFSAIGASRRRVWLTTPYFVPPEPLVAALTTAALRGVDVRVLVPRHNDLPLVAAAAWSFVEDVLAHGVRVFAYEPAMLHAKTMLVDDELAFVGTANFDHRSFRLNFEVVAALYDRAAVVELADQFAADLARSRAVTLAELAAAPLPARLTSAGARLLSPLL